ncbi:MAG: hypothetical protein ACE5KM_19775 [Planctomycetaceae bacterium]
MATPLVELLKQRSLRTQLERFAAVSDEIPRLAFVRAADDIARNRLTRLLRSRYETELRDAFQEHVFSQLEHPHIVTMADLLTSTELFIRNDRDFESQFDQFCNYLVATTGKLRFTQPFKVITGDFLEVGDLQVPIWRAETGFTVYYVGAMPLGEEHDDSYIYSQQSDPVVAPRSVYVRIDGICSTRSMRVFRWDLRRVLRTILRSLSLLNQLEPRHRDLGHNHLFLDFDKEAGASTEIDTWAVEPLFDAYYLKPSKKDSIHRRLRNALHLLVEADRQRHSSIGLSLSMTAIEALVCKKGSDISNQIAENVATLLEPDAMMRSQAVDFIKKLYDSRSRTLHGEILEHEATALQKARTLASGVLKAFLERKDFQARMGVQTETPDDLLRELRKSKFGDGEIPGVEASPVRKFWRERS